jgi:hypothetical protein
MAYITIIRKLIMLLIMFENYYGPTIYAFEAAEKNGKAADLQHELE